jgi:hypothetical protein
LRFRNVRSWALLIEIRQILATSQTGLVHRTSKIEKSVVAGNAACALAISRFKKRKQLIACLNRTYRSQDHQRTQGERRKEESQLSKYEETATEIRQSGHLITALRELGLRAEFHPDGANPVGYEGQERPERAQVIVRRNQIGTASNDIGFARKPGGTFAAVLSEYDRSIGFDEK